MTWLVVIVRVATSTPAASLIGAIAPEFLRFMSDTLSISWSIETTCKDSAMHLSNTRARLIGSAVLLLLPGCSDSEVDRDQAASARIDSFVESAEGALRDVDYGLPVVYVTEQVNATLAAVADGHNVEVRLLDLEVQPVHAARGMIEATARSESVKRQRCFQLTASTEDAKLAPRPCPEPSASG